MKTLISIQEPTRPPTATPGFALWQMGFRPFYLLASAFAAVSIGLWSLQFAGWLASPYLAGPMWHAHEMLFGFALAVIVGFLFTAGANWSGRPVLTGKPLAALAMVWVAGRVLVLSPFGWLSAIVNAAFPLLAAVALAVPFIASRNRRNYFFIALLCAMAAAQLAVHMVQLGAVRLPEWLGIQLALDLVLFIMAVMGGRVIPMFTNNGVPGAGARKHPVVEKASLGLVLTLALVDMLQWQGAALAAAAFACAALHFVRWTLWRPWKTLRAPLVWILHAAYGWIPVHLALRGFAELGWIGTSAATHALTVGAVGGLIIGMMTRTARGHTGRPLRASALDVACYLLITAAAAVRVGIPLVLPAMTIGAITFSALLWSCGFGLYAIGYWPVLLRARIDGKPG